MSVGSDPDSPGLRAGIRGNRTGAKTLTPLAHSSRPALKLAAFATLAAMAGCAQKPAAPVSTTRLYEIDQLGAAKACTAPRVTAAEGKPTPAAITVTNDGGWCGLTVQKPGGGPFSAGLLSTRPAHGKAYIHTVGDDTRIDYTPGPGFSGADAFTVTLLPGDGTVQVSVTVNPGAAPPPPAVSAPPPSPSRTPARPAAKAPAKKPAS
jgi:hypothetical protein